MQTSRKVLVTGGAGFIGSHVVEALLRRRYSVAVVDNFDEFYPPSLKERNLDEVRSVGEFQVHRVDIRDSAALRMVFDREKPNIVIHLAARAGVRPSILQPKLYEEVNVGGTLNLLMAAESCGVRKFVFGSSSSVYGATARVPFSEEPLELRPVSPYAATKLAGEMLCYTYSYLYHLPCICLRFFTVYGPRQRPDLAIRRFAEFMVRNQPIPIYGDGTAARDYTSVEDIVDGIIFSITYETQFDVFNLGNSNPVTLLELVRLLETAAKRRATLDFQPPQPGDVPRTWADISKARRLLGFEPRTQLADGLQRFWKWHMAERIASKTAGS